jgi:hypothetical protein
MRIFWSVAIAGLAAMVFAVGPALAAHPGELVLATQALHKRLVVGDIASSNAIGVVYQRGAYSFLRWSTDGGASFAAEYPLRDGRPATSPRLAACGDWMWATSNWSNTASGTHHFTVDYLNVTDPGSTAGRFRFVDAYGPDIACFGDVLGITSFSEDGTMFSVYDAHCSVSCVPAFTTQLATNGSGSEAHVATVDDGFVVTWFNYGLKVEHFSVSGSGSGLSVTPHTPSNVMANINVFSPVIAGDGSRVVIAYVRRNDTHMRISDDYGQTFGPRIIVRSVSTDPCCGGSGPDSVDARSGSILVEFGEGGGDPPGIVMAGRFTRNDGVTWKTTTSHGGGTQVGVLMAGAAAEAWDAHSYADRIYGKVPQEIGFKVTNLP